MIGKLKPDLVIVIAQMLLTGTLLLGFFLLSTIVLAGRAAVPADQLRLADTLFGALATMCAQAIAYWFARQRPNTPADPGQQ